MIPGSNILSTALRVIASQYVNWYKYTANTIGATGLVTSSYASSQTVLRGSVQPVPRNRYEALNLDWQKSYITWYVPDINASSITRNPNGNGDIIEWPVNRNGSLISGKSRRYQLIADTPWTLVDDWTAVIGVDIGPATGATTNA